MHNLKLNHLKLAEPTDPHPWTVDGLMGHPVVSWFAPEDFFGRPQQALTYARDLRGVVWSAGRGWPSVVHQNIPYLGTVLGSSSRIPWVVLGELYIEV